MSTNSQPINQSTIYQCQEFTTYLSLDGNQFQLIQVPNDRQKPFIFRNQAGQIVQAIPMSIIAAIQSVVSLFQTNTNSFTSSNSSQVNTQQQAAVTSLQTQQLRPNSSQTATVAAHITSSFTTRPHNLTHDATTMVTQQSIDNTQLPLAASLLNDCNIDTYETLFFQPNSIVSTPVCNENALQLCQRDVSSKHHNNDSSLDYTFSLSNSTTSTALSLSEIAYETDHCPQRSSSSNLLNKKRQRSKSFE